MKLRRNESTPGTTVMSEGRPAPTETALSPDTHALHEGRAVAIMPTPRRQAISEPTDINAMFADAMSRADGCITQGCHNVVPPRAATPRAVGWLLHYRCSDCGGTWTSNWNED